METKKSSFPTRSLKLSFFKIACMNEFSKKSVFTAKLDKHMQADLLAEQARIVARLAEITAILSNGNPPTTHIKSVPTQSFPKDFDRKAYAIGLIWRNPEISTRQLAQDVGIAQSTLFLPSWSDVAAVLRARKNISADYKDHHIDEEPENDHERYQ